MNQEKLPNGRWKHPNGWQYPHHPTEEGSILTEMLINARTREDMPRPEKRRLIKMLEKRIAAIDSNRPDGNPERLRL